MWVLFLIFGSAGMKKEMVHHLACPAPQRLLRIEPWGNRMTAYPKSPSWFRAMLYSGLVPSYRAFSGLFLRMWLLAGLWLLNHKMKKWDTMQQSLCDTLLWIHGRKFTYGHYPNSTNKQALHSYIFLEITCLSHLNLKFQLELKIMSSWNVMS